MRNRYQRYRRRYSSWRQPRWFNARRFNLTMFFIIAALIVILTVINA
ncbi:MAG: hypothetical protein WCL57_02285 [Chloroflexota bacterium]|nr:hypothetical protein [Chloroflexota bacterium]